MPGSALIIMRVILDSFHRFTREHLLQRNISNVVKAGGKEFIWNKSSSRACSINKNPFKKNIWEDEGRMQVGSQCVSAADVVIRGA